MRLAVIINKTKLQFQKDIDITGYENAILTASYYTRFDVQGWLFYYHIK